jgi:hypothetical protein
MCGNKISIVNGNTYKVRALHWVCSINIFLYNQTRMRLNLENQTRSKYIHANYSSKSLQAYCLKDLDL